MSLSAATFTKSGTKATTGAKLNADIFGLDVQDHILLHQAYVTYLANGRPNLATTKTRGLVRGGGRKPWKQKGTGRARFGSSRNPIWRGGGVVFGPSGNENYSKKLSTSAKRLALRQALSLSANQKQIVIIESLESLKGKTSEAVSLISKLALNDNDRILLVDTKPSTEARRSVNNLSFINLVDASNLNVFDITNADSIVISKAGIEQINQWLGQDSKKAKPTTKSKAKTEAK